MLKPRDIANVDFRQAWRGYNPDDVDQFVRKVVGAYEELYQENLRLKELTEQLKQRIDEYSQTEAHIDETLALARQTAADVKAAADERSKALLAEAEQRSASLVAEAEVRADALLRRARRDAEEHLDRVRQLAQQEQSFRARFRNLLESYWALLEEERRDAEQFVQSIRAVEDRVAATAETGAHSASDTSRWDLWDDDEDEQPDDIFDEEPLRRQGDESLEPTRRMDSFDFRGESSP